MRNLSSTDAQIAASDYSKWGAAYADLSADTEHDFHTKEKSLNKEKLLSTKQNMQLLMEKESHQELISIRRNGLQQIVKWGSAIPKPLDN